MSTILDALKKSEQERKLNSIPTLSDMPTPQERSRWLPVLLVSAVLILVGIFVLLAVRWWPQASLSSDSSASSTESLVEQGSTKEILSPDDIVVNVISYSDDIEQRFAMINGKLFREGEFVQAGLRVDSISVDAVVLNARGRSITRKP